MMNENSIKQKAEAEQVSTSLVFKEYVQVVILEYLFKKGLFSHLVFQGGTALRLAYQGVRYSEDLDFVLHKKNLPCFQAMHEELYPITSHIKKMIPFVLTAQLKIQKESNTFRRYCLILESSFLNAKDKTNIEIANIPSHKHHTMIIQHSQALLSTAITVETPEEIFSDKLLAFGARDYVKGRDLWDIAFLMSTLKISLNNETIDMVRKKISDYNLKKKDVLSSFQKKMQTLEEEGAQIFHNEMNKFLPSPYRETFENQYHDICMKELDLFNQLYRELKK